ncbi:phage virion protein [Citrobacter phage CR44b]|uniref:Phage virion protein n=1 Tax=Citrobacter phage CR44b TaxID=1455075 RepID=W6PN87_9CAUD|nr:phage virion protein [Citrobacter phage CR44b]CDM21577.1 phage virion protein [Citrobacter phage CR44b]
MTDTIMGADVNVLDGRSLSLEMVRLRNEVGALERNNTLNIFTSLDQLGLPITASMTQIAERLPQNSLLAIDATAGTQGATLPLPYFTHPTQAYMSGFLTAWRGNDVKKAYFEWRNEYLVAHADYNTYNVPATLPTKWTFMVDSIINKNGFGPGAFGNLMSNIWVPGTYYFNSSQMPGFTDSPTTAASFLKVDNWQGLPTSDRLYTLIENNGSTRTYTRQNANNWRNVPVVFPQSVADSELRVGDMKIDGNGRLHMRLGANLVGQIIYKGEPQQ